MNRFEMPDGDIITMARYNSKQQNFTVVTQDGYKIDVDQWNGRIVSGMMTTYIGDLKEFTNLMISKPNMWTNMIRGVE